MQPQAVKTTQARHNLIGAVSSPSQVGVKPYSRECETQTTGVRLIITGNSVMAFLETVRPPVTGMNIAA